MNTSELDALHPTTRNLRNDEIQFLSHLSRLLFPVPKQGPALSPLKAGESVLAHQMLTSGLRLFESRKTPPELEELGLRPEDLSPVLTVLRVFARWCRESAPDEARAKFLDEAGKLFPDIDRICIGKAMSVWKVLPRALGLYFPDDNAIVLFPDFISVVADSLSVSEEDLTAVVLIHEIGHWLHCQIVSDWPDGVFASHTKELQECIAQLFCKFLSDSADDTSALGNDREIVPGFQLAFKSLLVRQTSEYHAFEAFADCQPFELLRALQALRSFNDAGIDVFRSVIDNYLGVLRALTTVLRQFESADSK